MKKIIVFFLNSYINFFAFVLKSITGAGNCCRFSPTCSEYAKEAVLKKGVVKGSFLSAARLLKCQPFYKFA
jgi:putative membrane protein insertion efficiency factor